MAVNRSLSDSQLVQKVISGETAFFDVLVSRYSKVVKAMLDKRNFPHSEDLLQEAFIKAYLNLDKYDERYPFGGWVMTIAKNVSIDQERKNVSTTDGAMSIEGISTPSLYPNPEQIVVREQQAQKLKHTIQRLPECYREIINYRFDEELSYEEISHKLSIPVGTVKTQIHRARARLMKMMEEE